MGGIKLFTHVLLDFNLFEINISYAGQFSSYTPQQQLWIRGAVALFPLHENSWAIQAPNFGA